MPKNPLAKRLSEIDLPEREALVYTALLELQGSGVAAVAKRAGIQRTYVYDILESLRKKGLASWYLKSGRKVYQPESPHKIKRMLEERLDSFSDLLPDLLSLYKTEPGKPKLRFYEGIQGAIDAYSEMLQTDGYDNLCEPEAFLRVMPAEFAVHIGETVVRRGMRVRELFTKPSGPLPPHDKGYQAPLQQSRRLPFPVHFTTDLCICQDKAYLITFDTEVHTLAIEGSGIVQTLRAMFEMLWQMTPEIK